MALAGAVRGRRSAQPLDAGPAHISVEEELELRFRRVILDAGARQRLLDAKQARHPELPRVTLIQLVLEEYERDRR